MICRNTVLRAICSVALGLFVTGWVASYYSLGFLGYSGKPASGCEVGWSWGALYVMFDQYSLTPAGWHGGIHEMDSHGPVLGANWKRIGFDWDFSFSMRRGRQIYLAIPFWLPSVIFGVGGLWVWLRRSPNAQFSRFPVSVADATTHTSERID